MTPKTTADAFDLFHEALKLDPAERLAAERIHNEITSVLRSGGLIEAAFLQGSFARKTMIAPLRDIDKVVILHPTLAGLEPDEVMDRIQAALQKTFPQVVFTRTKHSLQIDFGSTTFNFDTVPAWETTTDDDDVCIANREASAWERSNTRELIRVVAQRNSRCNGRFVHQVRMGKQAIKHLLDGSIPGLHIESWAFAVINSATDHDKAAAAILAYGASLIGGTYTEPTGLEVISGKLKPEVILAARPVLVTAAARAAEARQLTDAGDHNEAIRIWGEIFGPTFPAATAQSAADALSRSFIGGGITSAGTVSTTAARQTSRPVRPWGPR